MLIKKLLQLLLILIRYKNVLSISDSFCKGYMSNYNNPFRNGATKRSFEFPLFEKKNDSAMSITSIILLSLNIILI